MSYLSKSGLLRVQKLETYVFTPHDLNTQEMGIPIYHEISLDIWYLLQTMSLISFKPLGIKRSPNFFAKFVIHDPPNCLELLKYNIHIESRFTFKKLQEVTLLVINQQ